MTSCKGVSISDPNTCSTLPECIVARGAKRSFCRTKTRKTKAKVAKKASPKAKTRKTSPKGKVSKKASPKAAPNASSTEIKQRKEHAYMKIVQNMNILFREYIEDMDDNGNNDNYKEYLEQSEELTNKLPSYVQREVITRSQSSALAKRGKRHQKLMKKGDMEDNMDEYNDHPYMILS
jgi:hypothetical protein